MATFNNYFYFPRKIPQGYDVYHISNQTIAKCSKYVKPCVITCQDVFSYTFKKEENAVTRFFLRRHLKYLNNCEKIIVTANCIKKSLTNLFEIPEEKIKVIHHGVDTAQFKPRNKTKVRKKLNLPLNKKIILHVGLDNPRKNVAMVVKSFYKIEKKDSNIILIRIGGRGNETMNLIRKLGLEQKVKIFERVPPNEIHEFYNAADLFVFPSLSEGFGLPPLEAMASGIPVISSNVDSLPEVIGNGAITMEPKDVDEWVKMIQKVLTNDNLRSELIRVGLKQAKKFSWKDIAKQTWKTYEDVLKV